MEVQVTTCRQENDRKDGNGSMSENANMGKMVEAMGLEPVMRGLRDGGLRK